MAGDTAVRVFEMVIRYMQCVHAIYLHHELCQFIPVKLFAVHIAVSQQLLFCLMSHWCCLYAEALLNMPWGAPCCKLLVCGTTFAVQADLVSCCSLNKALIDLEKLCHAVPAIQHTLHVLLKWYVKEQT